MLKRLNEEKNVYVNCICQPALTQHVLCRSAIQRNRSSNESYRHKCTSNRSRAQMGSFQRWHIKGRCTEYWLHSYENSGVDSWRVSSRAVYSKRNCVSASVTPLLLVCAMQEDIIDAWLTSFITLRKKIFLGRIMI